MLVSAIIPLCLIFMIVAQNKQIAGQGHPALSVKGQEADV
jgi:hypothetical protein